MPFIELGISELCKENAICAMIIPYSFTNQLYAKLSRDMITTKFNLYELTDLQDVKVFDNAVVINCIVFISKNKFQNNITISGIDENLQIHAFLDKTRDNLVQDKKTLVFNTTSQERNVDRHRDLNVLGDFCYISIGMVLNADEKTAKGEFKKDDLISNTKDKIHCKEYIEAKDIEKYTIKRIRYLEYNTPRSPSKLRRPTFPQLYENEKILTNKIGNLKAIFDKNNIICDQTNRICILWRDLKGVKNKSISGSIKKFSRFSRDELEKLSLGMNLKYILGILNSKYSNILLDNIRGLGNIDINPEYLKNLPIPKINSKNEKLANELISLVDEILNLKEQDKNTNTKIQEDKINSIVYKLYNLSKEEIKIIEGK
ncbi:DNA modification methylase [Campylobacter lari]|nr:DNA modification methylase [Campylobacter lari]